MAILVAISVLMFGVLAAFAVDFGLAYNSKRQLQTSSDAAALAAASVYTKLPGDCTTLAADAAARAEAESLADSYFTKNLWAPTTESTHGLVDVSCNADEELVVTYSSSGDTDTVFGPLAGSDSTITTSREATAVVDVASTVRSGLRPLALCSAALPNSGQIDGSVVRIDYPGGGHAPPPSCPVAGNPGNWWLTDCPGERTGSASELADQIRNGCPDPVSIVSGQDGASSPEELTVVLGDACPSAPKGSEECLSGNPGQISQGQTPAAWKSLIDAHVPFTVPVFCAPPQCSEGTIDGNGTNSVIPVYKIAGMYVCGYHFKKNAAYQSKVGACAATSIDVDKDDSNDNYLLVTYTLVQTSGSTKSSDCALDSECDGGLRRVHLEK